MRTVAFEKGNLVYAPFCTHEVSQWEHDAGNPPNGAGRFTGRTFSKSFSGSFSSSQCIAGSPYNQPPGEIRGKVFLYHAPSNSPNGPFRFCYASNNNVFQTNSTTTDVRTVVVQSIAPNIAPCGDGYYRVEAYGEVLFGSTWYANAMLNTHQHHFPS